MTLQRRKPMAHGGNPLLRTTALRAVRPLLGSGTLRRTEMVAKRRNTDPTKSVVDVVKTRARRYAGELPDGRDVCEMCTLLPAGHTHHRNPRGAGGSRDPRKNQPSNLLRLCPQCHRLVESQRDTAYAEGWLVRDRFDSADVPVRLGTNYWLLDDAGGRTLYTSTERTAT